MKPISTQISTKSPHYSVVQKLLLFCGVLSSLVYFFANIITVIKYEGYNTASQTVSELSAIDTPTRGLWVSLLTVYSVLLIAFGIGILISANGNKWLRNAGIVIIIDAIFGYFWPPMHQREVLAAGGGTISDTLHIVWTFITVPLMMLTIGFGAAAFGKRFRNYSIITLMILFFAGILTGIDGPKIQTNSPTPWIGVWERICIGVNMIWVIVFSWMLLSKKQSVTSAQIKTTSLAA
jgi:uncharacterized protein DUF998